MNVESVFSICESSVSRLNRSVKMNSENAVDHSFFNTNCSINRNRSRNKVASIMRRFCRLQFVAFRVFSRHALQFVRSLRQSLQKLRFGKPSTQPNRRAKERTIDGKEPESSQSSTKFMLTSRSAASSAASSGHAEELIWRMSTISRSA
jgi:hypothetical protein